MHQHRDQCPANGFVQIAHVLSPAIAPKSPPSINQSIHLDLQLLQLHPNLHFTTVSQPARSAPLTPSTTSTSPAQPSPSLLPTPTLNLSLHQNTAKKKQSNIHHTAHVHPVRHNTPYIPTSLPATKCPSIHEALRPPPLFSPCLPAYLPAHNNTNQSIHPSIHSS